MPSIIFRMPTRYLKRERTRRELRYREKKSAYEKRDNLLFRLGFVSYSHYLRSDLWKAIRSAKLAVDPKCEACGKDAEQVHHLSYMKAVLLGKRQRKLVSVCGHCHKVIEFRDDGTKRELNEAFEVTKNLIDRKGGWEKHKKYPKQT